MAPCTLWIACALFGITTTLIALSILSLFPNDTASDVSGYGGPVYALNLHGFRKT